MEVCSVARNPPLSWGSWSLHFCERAVQVSHPALPRHPCIGFGAGESYLRGGLALSMSLQFIL